jgi:hypothetical protein
MWKCYTVLVIQEVLYMSKLVALRLPDDLLEVIDGMAKAEGMNRSQAIIALLREGDLTPISSSVVAPVKVSRPAIVESKPKIETATVELKLAACKCGATGVQIVNGKKVCASCGRARDPLKA